MGFVKSILLASVLLMPVITEASVSTLVADTKSGLILASNNATEQQYPASLTKVMTLYMTFSAIEKGILKMEDRLPVSLKAAKQPRSKLYVRAGQTISVKDAIMALIIKSANDVAVVLAEALAPSEEEFARMMTKTAKNIGLKGTTFKNASGLHNPDQVTTAQDMAILTMAMIHHFPQYYKLFSKKSFTYKGKVYRSHNHVQKRYAGAEGLKTGYISAVGYNIISTAKRNNNRLVSVVIGGNTVAQRDRQAMKLLDNGFSKIDQHKNQKDKQNLLNKKALLEKPDLTPELKIMAKRLDSVIKSNNSVSRYSLLQLNPFGSKQAVAAEPINIYQEKISENTYPENMGSNNTFPENYGNNVFPEDNGNNVFPEDNGNNTFPENMGSNNFPPKEAKLEVATEEDIIYKPTVETITEEKSIQQQEQVIQETAPVIIEDLKETTTTVKTQKIKPAQNEPKAVINALIPKKINANTQNIDSPLSQGIQVGAFRTAEAAFNQAKRAAKILNMPESNIHTPEALPLIRARLYGFKNREEAKKACQKLKKHYMNCIALPSGQ